MMNIKQRVNTMREVKVYIDETTDTVCYDVGNGRVASFTLTTCFSAVVAKHVLSKPEGYFLTSVSGMFSSLPNLEYHSSFYFEEDKGREVKVYIGEYTGTICYEREDGLVPFDLSSSSSFSRDRAKQAVNETETFGSISKEAASNAWPDLEYHSSFYL